jgi:alkaline phosphatase
MIIVAADHETGGMRLNTDGIGSYLMDGPFSMPNGEQFWVDWSNGNHTAAPIAVTAQGPYTEILSGEYHLTRIFDTMFLMLYTESQ